MVEALKALSHRQRACVVLRYYADLSEQQTAGLLGISLGTVKSQTREGAPAPGTDLLADGGEPRRMREG